MINPLNNFLLKQNTSGILFLMESKTNLTKTLPTGSHSCLLEFIHFSLDLEKGSTHKILICTLEET